MKYRTKKTGLGLLVLAAGMFGTLAIAHQEKTGNTNRQQPMAAAELESLAAKPSLDQAVFKIAAEKLRDQKAPTTTVELPLTAKVTKTAAPNCYYHICVYSGTKAIACEITLCPPSTK